MNPGPNPTPGGFPPYRSLRALVAAIVASMAVSLVAGLVIWLR